MRLSLVIEGDGSGAKRALEETTTAVETLGAKSEETARKLEEVGKGVQWESSDEHSKRMEEWGVRSRQTREELRGIGEDSKAAEAGAKSVTEAAREVVPEIQAVGNTADTTRGQVSGLSSVLLGVAGGVAGAIAITAVGEGLKLAAGAAGDLFREITSNAPQIERALEAHAGLVGRIKGAWSEAEGAASSYGVNSIAQLRFESQQNVGRLETASAGALSDLQDRGAFAPIMQDMAGGRDRLGPLREEINAFRRDLREGDADVIKFRRNIAEIAEALPTDSPFRGVAEKIFEDTQAAAELQAELERSRDLLNGLKGDAEAAATALGGKSERYVELTDDAAAAADAIGTSADQITRTGEAAAGANPDLAEYDRILKSIAGGQAPQFMSTREAVTTPLLPGFAGGGHTGYGAVDKIAGFVHGNEYVMDAETTARIGVGNLDAIRAGVRGYAGGGFVGAGAFPPAPAASGAGNAVAGVTDALRMLQGTVIQFGNILWNTSDAGQALGSVIQSVSQKFLDFSLRALDQFMFGGGGGGFGWLGSLFGLGGGAFPAAPAPFAGGLYHGGGIVGGSPAMSRLVSPSVFMDAPRSSGLQAGERPIIAMDGEEIGWPDQLARKYGGHGSASSTVINNFHVETPNPKAFAESRSTVARAAGRLAARSGRHS